MEASIISIIPPVLAIVLVITTRKVVLSLGLGVLSAAFIVADYGVLETLRLVWTSFAELFWADGAVNTGKVFILVFTLALGVIAALVLMSGGSAAFSDWASSRITTRRGSQGLAASLGIAIFIDDYFNALAVGQVARPVTDRLNVARAKLAYLIDSTSAPVAVLAPFSSWGAYIIGLMAPIVGASTLQESDVEVFIKSAGMNYYAIATLLVVLLVVVFRIDLGPMRREEKRALVDGHTYDRDEEIPGELAEDLPVHEPGAKRSLVVPFLALVVGVVGGMVWTGYDAGGSWAVLDILANADVTEALIYGAVLGLGSALYYYLRYTTENPKFGSQTLGRGVSGGLASMLPAVYILLLAWMLGALIESLGTGEYLAGLVERADLEPQWLIPMMFVMAGAMAFSTGTSWGSFGILLPIAGTLMTSVGEPTLLVPAFGAVLAGAVFGDHCSPISDTTILSSTGASCNVITHVTTQLPYALFGALAALVGYVVLAWTGSGLIGFLGVLVTLALGTAAARSLVQPLEDEVTERAPQPAR
ncbi:Na+/H+ antiporter NhaC family protein [Nocardioides donggukensis]|uniref:Na+/H+ antiporter NhaC family protein n=1 Tax=Nocardioides donggukensis TaxID=2774019 RepID=A0A927K4U9_9ACTN|nr:Na+/H+ antiporter NhaC family protein [Nocardioides donggukensis]MBD8868988.1 Na+/H+ antiporter NhaC family protein [Nocardioides donggukensis]